MYICKCLQDPKGMLKLLKTDLDRERFLESFVKVRGFTLFPKGRDDTNISFYRKFVKPREFIKNLFVRIQETRYLHNFAV